MIILKEKKLNEKLVTATKQEFELLKQQIKQVPMLKKQLTTPMKLIPQYDYIHAGVPNAENYPLLDVLEFLVLERRNRLLFSKAGISFTGFVTYVETGKDITGMKIASFYDDQVKVNITITDDLKNFIASEMPSHDKIGWEVEKGNRKAMSLYQRSIPLWFPQYSLMWEWNSKKGRWIYTLTK